MKTKRRRRHDGNLAVQVIARTIQNRNLSSLVEETEAGNCNLQNMNVHAHAKNCHHHGTAQVWLQGHAPPGSDAVCCSGAL